MQKTIHALLASLILTGFAVGIGAGGAWIYTRVWEVLGPEGGAWILFGILWALLFFVTRRGD